MARILIVDDERPIRHTLGESLSREGYETAAAADAETALAVFREQPCDVVVADIVLPGKSGLDLARSVRATNPDIQVILMTTVPKLDNAVEAVRAEVFDCLVKPVSRNAILRAVGNALRLKRMADERARLEAENRRYQDSLERLVGERTAALEEEVGERVRAEEALRRAVERLRGLRGIDRAIREAESPHGIARAAIRHLSRLCGCRMVAVTRFDREAGQAVLLAIRREGGGEKEFERGLPEGAPAPGEVREPTLRQVEDLAEETGLSGWEREFLGEGVRSHLEIPLHAHGAPLGVLSLGEETPGAFSGEVLEAAQEVADHLSIALQEAVLLEEIRAHALKLEARVAERTADIERVNRQLGAVSKGKSAFLANMSHELRTPLNGILGFSQLLLERNPNLTPERETRYLQNILRSGKHLLQLINDVLDLSKVEAGKITLQPAPQNLPELLEEVLVIIRGLANKKSQRLEVSVQRGVPPVWADGVRLKQICFNLLSNGVKFTPEGGRITLTAHTVPAEVAGPPGGQAREWLEIVVADSGAGIRAEDLPKLFQEFGQFETTRAQHGEGAGLGLALTKRLVELHGGSVRAESAGEGLGSTFRVRLPVGG